MAWMTGRMRELIDLTPDTNYELKIDGEQALTQRTDSNGNLLFTTVLDKGEAEVQFMISQISN
ncbi:MAG: hypothetical protein WD035_07695 [Balneolaceae bacterium]